MRLFLPAALTASLLAPAHASQVAISVEIPSLDVAEYHRPYVALWIETPEGAAVANLAVWYDHDMRNDEGEDWLKDLRQWWRRIGRQTDMPVDGVSGPTHPPGAHELAFDANAAQLIGLAPGDYEFVIEAVREVGGRELLRAPLQWPPKERQTIRLEGARELGAVILTLKP